jgi:hypothetical protein
MVKTANFDTLGAALHFIALTCDAISAGHDLKPDSRTIETNFGELALKYENEGI